MAKGFYTVPDELGRLLAVKTGEDGRFAMSLAPPGWQVGLRASAPGRGEVGKLATEEEASFRLAPAGGATPGRSYAYRT